MNVLLDLTVVLDVVQNRGPFYQDSAQVLTLARLGQIEAAIPTHAFTTLYYIIAKAAGKSKAEQIIDWLLVNFGIGFVDRAVLHRARQLAFRDFEDAVVASLAEAGRCQYVVTRNIPDFAGYPVPAITPTDFLGAHSQAAGTPPAAK